jgi:structure-specific endonuclease subunit SLX1
MKRFASAVRSKVDTYQPLKPLTVGAIEDGRFYCCYLLSSLAPATKNKAYIGFTVDPARRLRQHNGGILGGAKRTKRKGRPWEQVVVIYGFPSAFLARQFEWHWQCSWQKSRRMACIENHPGGPAARLWFLTFTVLTCCPLHPLRRHSVPSHALA